MVYQVNPSLGIDLESAEPQHYWDLNSDSPTPALGTKQVGTDGHDYIQVEAAANIATLGTDVTINESTWVATAGAGGFETVVAGVLAGDIIWVRRTTL